MSDEIDFVSICISKGIKKIPDICQEINKEVLLLNIELDELNSKKNDLLKKKNYFTNLNSQLSNSISSSEESCYLNPNLEFNKLTPYLQNLTKKIFSLIKENEKMNSKEIVETISIKENRAILCSIKWLWDNRIIIRNKQDQFTKGPLWEKFE